MIHTSHLFANLALLRNKIGPGVAICAAVKANAYGHDASLVGPLLAEVGVEALAVATAEEGLQLRAMGLGLPILLYGALQDDEWVLAAQANLQPLLSSVQQLAALKAAVRSTGTSLKVHLKVDTGMGRLGCAPSEAAELARALVHTMGLEFEGLCTHFASSESDGPRTVGQQMELFSAVRKDLASRGYVPRHVHVSNSGAILSPVGEAVTLVRPGIALYGYDPGGRPDTGLRPVLELVSRVGYVKTVPAGTPLSYGSRYVTERRTDVATIPVGYADGYRRSYTNLAPVLVAGRLFKVSGTVCMDQFLVDLGPESGVKVGDEVVLFGPPLPQRKVQAPTVDDLALLAQTISYELLCGLSPRIPRVAVT